MNMTVKRVEGHYKKEKEYSLTCAVCTSGWSNEDSKEELMKRHGKHLGQPCSCGKGTYEYQYREWDDYQPGYTVVTCSCRKKVYCHHFTNTCSCGKDYNQNGSELAPRSQWGEETGETWMDCY